jgi:lipoprotein-anchoring transpeptidase ErfK/SrfK
MARRKNHVSVVGWLAVLLAVLVLALLWRGGGKMPARRIARVQPARSHASRTGPPAVATDPSAGKPSAAILEPHPGIPAPQVLESNSFPGLSTNWPRPVQNVLEAQVALDRQGISCGSLDGRIGPQTSAALLAFQLKEYLPPTGKLDAATKQRLVLAFEPFTTYSITTNDLGRLQPLSSTWLGKSKQTALDFETVLELVSEKSHTHPNLVKRLNPATDWTNVMAGATVRLPAAFYPEPHVKAAFVRITLAARVIEAFDAATNLLAHFPCSIAQRVEKRPVGELHVTVLAPNPTYTFDPDVFPESTEARELKTKLILPPGPNNPVGVAWIGLDKAGYGIHGTPQPEQIGRTESHGCFRLANWNAEYLLRLVSVGTPVFVEL